MTTEAELLEHIARRPSDAEAYLAYADCIEDLEPARAALIRVQAAQAEGSTEALDAEEARLLSVHRAALTGPIGFVNWHRGFATVVRAFPGQPGVESRDPRFASVAEWLSSPAARFVRDLALSRWPLPLPPSVERLSRGPCVLTAEVLRAPRLRSLSVSCLVDSVPLVHDGIEELSLPCDLAIVDALDGARLPALAKLRVHDVVPDVALLERFAELARALPARDIELAFLPEASDAMDAQPFGVEVSRALAPIADRIVGLGLAGHRWGNEAHCAWDVPLPRLRHLEFCTKPSAATLRCPAFASATELSLVSSVLGREVGPCIDELVESGVAPRVRVLRVAPEYGMERPFERLSRGDFENLEELAYLHRRGATFEGLRPDAFPRLARWQLYGTELALLAETPLAERVTRLAFSWVDPKFDWAAVRRRLPRLARLEHRAELVRRSWSSPIVSPPSASEARRLRAMFGEELAFTHPEAPPPAPTNPDAQPIAPRTIDPVLASLWALGCALPYAIPALVGPHWMPAALAAALPNIQATLGLSVDVEALRALDAEALDEGIEGWTDRYGKAVRNVFGDEACAIFELALCAGPAHASLCSRGGSLALVPTFLQRFEELPPALRVELAPVRGWLRATLHIEAPRTDARVAARTPDGRPRCFGNLAELTHHALRAPFRSLDEIDVPPPPPPQAFDTANRELVVRRALQHWIHHLIGEGHFNVTLKGDAEKGSYAWADGESQCLALAWNPAGVVAVAHDIYADGDNKPRALTAVLGAVPASMRPLVRAAEKALGQGASCGFWISERERRRDPSAPTLNGNPILEPLVCPMPIAPRPRGESSGSADAVVDALVARILAGGGAITPEQRAREDPRGARQAGAPGVALRSARIVRLRRDSFSIELARRALARHRRGRPCRSSLLRRRVSEHGEDFAAA